MPIDPEVQTVIDSMKEEIATLRSQIRDVEDDVAFHVGTDYGSNMQNSPHPNLSVNTVEFGGGVGLATGTGLQLQATLFDIAPGPANRVMWTSTDWSKIYSDVYGGLQSYAGTLDLSVLGLRALFDSNEDDFPLRGTAMLGVWDINSPLWDHVLRVLSSSDTDTSGAPVLSLNRFTGSDDGDVDGFAVYRDSAGNWRTTLKRASTTVNIGAWAGDGSELTIDGGWVLATQGYHRLDTQSDAGSDDLDTIDGGATGMVLVLRAENGARTVVLKDGTGNLKLAGDCTLDNAEDTVALIFDGSNWLEIARSNNGA